MPAVYLGHCETCGYEHRCSDSVYAIILDRESALPSAHEELTRVVVLAHPGEDEILEQVGYTLSTAGAEGRLLRIRRRICPACGTAYEQRRVTFPALMPGWWLHIIIFTLPLGVVWFTTQRYLLALALGGVALVLVPSLSDAVIHAYLRHKKRHLIYRGYNRPDTCPACEHSPGLSPGNISHPIPCPKCRQKTLVYRGEGKS